MYLRDTTGYMIANTGRRLTSSLTQLFQPYNLTSEQWSLLIALRLHDGVSQKELAELTDKDPANVTRILDQLQRKGLVRREANPDDRRAVCMRITPEGSEVAATLVPIEERFIEEIVAGIPQADLETFKSVIRAINLNLERRQEAD